MRKRFVPDDWQLTERLQDYARKKGLSDSQIEDQEEAFRLCQFPREILCWDRAWQRWIRTAIEWGKVTPHKEPKYRQPQQMTEEERRREHEKWKEDMKRLKVVK